MEPRFGTEECGVLCSVGDAALLAAMRSLAPDGGCNSKCLGDWC